ncbi:hypothetical protein TSAR_005326 [Trichomalopsis sarcophagae]|uniref:Uncharacterized protein n=1 Tax=Trichomalopsis sarcophagae TaxID=543379 RepID=A0A232F2J0_9HYME|nr:hypothetical protein TSAR_005326 [Trichomalopsis sarcophagae]
MLRQMRILRISGKGEDWISFSDLFTSLVHSGSGISDVTKLQYHVMLNWCGYRADQGRDDNQTRTMRALGRHFSIVIKLWEAELSEKDQEFVPEEDEPERDINSTFWDLLKFLERRAQALKMLNSECKVDKRLASTSTSGPQGPAEEIDMDESVKTLGVHWNPAQDQFRFSVSDITKRSILFNNARLFDPLRRKGAQEPLLGFLTLSELAEARSVVIRLSQASSFAVEIEALKAGGVLPKGNRLSKLNPFIGKDNTLRVGGRLSHFSLFFDCKHPPILSQESALSHLFVYSAHQLCLHGGFTLTSSVLMQQA